MTASLLPNGKQQFFDSNGNPLASGTVNFYVPSTTTPKDTWQDAGQTILNTNPVVLDAAGEALIYGNGNYRQVVKDSVGNLIWDQQTSGVGGSTQAHSDTLDELSQISVVSGNNGYQIYVNPTSNGFLLRKPLFGREPEAFGAAGTGSGDDVTAVNASIADAGYGKEVDLRGSYLVSAYNNAYGGIFRGPGRILTAVTGGFWQRNTYADDKELVVGKEYLARAYQFIKVGQDNSSGTLIIKMFGDSTIAGGNGEDLSCNAALSAGLKRNGIPNHVIYNLGVGGTTWADLNAIPQLASNVGLFIIKYGINDAGLGLPALVANMDAKLSAIRAATYGDLGSLAILLVGPNSTSDSPNGRDERWYEQVRGIYAAMARKYYCAYFDTYAFLQDSRVSAGIWMDNPFSNGIAIHPLGIMNAWIWGGIAHRFFGGEEVATYSTNGFTNEGSTTSSVLVGALPNAYPFGMSFFRATTGNGWPIDGAVLTYRNASQVTKQDLINFASGSTKVLTRTANVSGNSWNPWTGQANAITLQNGWVNTGGVYAPPYAYRDETGRVFVEGMISSGTTTAGTIVGILPVGFRPSVSHQFATLGQTSLVGLNVDSAGQITLQTAGQSISTSLGGIHFMAA